MYRELKSVIGTPSTAVAGPNCKSGQAKPVTAEPGPGDQSRGTFLAAISPLPSSTIRESAIRSLAID